jgi:hypothetical protein
MLFLPIVGNEKYRLFYTTRSHTHTHSKTGMNHGTRWGMACRRITAMSDSVSIGNVVWKLICIHMHSVIMYKVPTCLSWDKRRLRIVSQKAYSIRDRSAKTPFSQSYVVAICRSAVDRTYRQRNQSASSGEIHFAFCLVFNLLKPTGCLMHEQFNIQQLYVLPHTLYLGVLYLSENKRRLMPLTA